MNYFPKFNKREKALMKTEHQRGLIKNSVEWFAHNIKKNMMEHLDREWKRESVANLMSKLQGELEEFYDAIAGFRSRDEVLGEAADVASCLMMIADVYKEKVINK